jgi:uncharacterized membrane protein YoaK (UPF0700 family)
VAAGAREKSFVTRSSRAASEAPPGSGSRRLGKAAVSLLLAAAAGTVDAITFTVLHQIFTANMTGNTTTLGIAAGRGNVATLVPLGVAVAVFVVAIVLATVVIEIASRRGAHATAAPMLLLEAALLAVLMVDGHHILHNNTAPDHRIGGFYVLLTLAVLAMGVQTATLTKALGRTLRTTFVSGLLTTFGQELVNALAPEPGERGSYLRGELGLGGRRESARGLCLHLAVWLAFLAGAVWGGFAEPHWRTWPLAAPIAAVLAAGAIDLRDPIHRHAPQ